MQPFFLFEELEMAVLPTDQSSWVLGGINQEYPKARDVQCVQG